MCLALEDKTEQVFRAVVPVIPLLTSCEHSSCSMSLSKLDIDQSLHFSQWCGILAKLSHCPPESYFEAFSNGFGVNSPPRADFNLLTWCHWDRGGSCEWSAWAAPAAWLDLIGTSWNPAKSKTGEEDSGESMGLLLGHWALYSVYSYKHRQGFSW